jgi:hypothetical protein
MRLLCLSGLLAFGIVAIVSAKGTTTRIVITGPQLSEPIQLRDRSVVAPFNVWSGPGTRLNGVEGMDGFIVDWRAGSVQPPVENLQQFEISFYADGDSTSQERIAYVVSYALDPQTAEGYVYLPGKGDARWGPNVRSILRGPKYEGHWFRATDAWQNVMRTYVISHTRRQP